MRSLYLRYTITVLPERNKKWGWKNENQYRPAIHSKIKFNLIIKKKIITDHRDRSTEETYENSRSETSCKIVLKIIAYDF